VNLCLRSRRTVLQRTTAFRRPAVLRCLVSPEPDLQAVEETADSHQPAIARLVPREFGIFAAACFQTSAYRIISFRADGVPDGNNVNAFLPASLARSVLWQPEAGVGRYYFARSVSMARIAWRFN
jgi:hypothetical protein